MGARTFIQKLQGAVSKLDDGRVMTLTTNYEQYRMNVEDVLQFIGNGVSAYNRARIGHDLSSNNKSTSYARMLAREEEHSFTQAEAIMPATPPSAPPSEATMRDATSSVSVATASTSTSPGLASSSPVRPRGPLTCFRCRQPGHCSVECTNPKNLANVQCHQCGEYGHVWPRILCVPTGLLAPMRRATHDISGHLKKERLIRFANPRFDWGNYCQA